MWFIISSLILFAEPLSISRSTVSFLAVGRPAMIKIRGSGDCLTGNFKVSGKEILINAECDLKKVSTGIDLRDSHMRDKYLEVEKFPKAQFIGSAPFKDGKNPFQGKLKVHGEEIPVAGEVMQEEGSEGGKKWVFELKTKVTDHKITVPEYLKIKVAEEITITVELHGTLS